MIVDPGLPESWDAQNETRIMPKRILTPPLILLTMGEELKESFERGPANLEENSKARLSNAPKRFELYNILGT